MQSSDKVLPQNRRGMASTAHHFHHSTVGIQVLNQLLLGEIFRIRALRTFIPVQLTLTHF